MHWGSTVARAPQGVKMAPSHGGLLNALRSDSRGLTQSCGVADMVRLSWSKRADRGGTDKSGGLIKQTIGFVVLP